MQDTKTRIQQLKNALPGVKERLAAVAILLVFSIAMMTSVSFAWLTISAAPEVTGISTTVAANGNLEIALANPLGLEPGDSKVGDSMATEGQTVQNANLTWGNLVNLTDGYGLSELVLRPAQLNIGGLVEGSPLWGATYDADGRITRLNKNFAFANWEPPVGNLPGQFTVSDVTQYGVRAISSFKYSNAKGDILFKEVCDAVDIPLGQSMQAYSDLVRSTDNPYMDALAGLLGDYLTAQFGDGTATLNVAGHVESLYQMMVAFEEAYRLAGEAMAKAANVQQFAKFGANQYTDYTFDTLMAASKESLAANGVTFPAYGTTANVTVLDQFKANYNRLVSDIEKMSQYRGLSQVLWPAISSIVNNMVEINSTEVDGYPVSSIGKSVALELIKKDDHVAIIKKGALFEYEKLTGRNMYVVDMAVKAKYIVSITLKADVYTNLHPLAAGAQTQSDFDRVMAHSKGKFNGDAFSAEKVSEDTYGLALDFWLRTNEDYPVLTLEGTVVKKETEEDVFVTIGETEYQVYTATVNVSDGTEGGQTQSVEISAIQVDGKWYELTSSNKQGSEISPTNTKPKKNVIVELIGAEGENRVWQDNMALEPNSTTQGGGSFYVYYADTPEDGLRSLELLKCIKIAFVDGDNNWLATATLNTGENEYFSANGKYYVPMVITEGGETYTNDKGDIVKGITRLKQNTPIRITAILYLDGAELTNEMVLAASDIQGTLNIQFGTDGPLNNMGDEVLENAIRDVSATVDKTSFNYDTDNDLSTNVTVSISGDQPTRVTARFQRAITATQGTRLEEMIFQPGADGNWHASYTFDSPGTYVLRSVTIDGVEVDLPEPRTVTIAGFTLRTLVMETDSVMTAASSVSRPVTLTFASSDPDKMPRTVQGRLIHSGGNHSNVTFTYNTTSSTWTGTANLATSGTYTLEYLVLDGDYYPIDPAMQKTVEVSLGMRVRVNVVRPVQEPMVDENGNIVYEPLLDENGNPVKDENGNPVYKPLLDANGDHVTDENGIPMYQPVMITVAAPLNFKYMGDTVTFHVGVVVMDDQGTQLTDLDNVALHYLRDGSSLLENGLKAENLTWNETTRRYEGSFGLEAAGVYNFAQVVVAGDGVTNYLTNATEAPTITAISPEPPAYQQGTAKLLNLASGQTSLFAPNGDATVEAKISYSATGEYYAVFTRQEDGKRYFSPGTRGTEVDNVWNWTFPVPKNEGYQDGTWQLTEIWAGNGVYDKAGNEYTFDKEQIADSTKHMVLDVPDGDFPWVQVAQRITVTFPAAQDIRFSGSFMEAHDLAAGAFTVMIMDYNGNALPGVSNVNMVLQHKTSTMQTYGHYTANLSGVTENFERFELGTTTSDNIRFASNEVKGLKLAGAYTIQELEFTLAGKTYSYGPDAAGGQSPLPTVPNQVIVESAKPTVTVTGVSPNTTMRVYTVAHPTTDAHIASGNYNERLDAYSAKVYMYVANNSGAVDTESTQPITPKVTLALSDAASYTSWSVDVGHATNSEYIRSFTFTANSGDVTIGGATNGTMGQIFGQNAWVESYGTIYPAGRQEIKQIEIVYNDGTKDHTFTVDLSHTVTIENPLAPAIASFKVNDSTFAEIIPNRTITGATVTFDKVEWTATIEEPVGEATWSAYTSDGEVTDANGNPIGRVYGYAKWSTGSGLKTKHYRSYQYYYWTRFVSSYTGSIQTYTQKKQVTAWVINGQTYAWDAAIPTSVFHEGLNDVVAVVSNVGNPSTPTVTTTTSYKYLYGYVADSVKEDNRGFFGGAYDDVFDSSCTQMGSNGTSKGDWTGPTCANAGTADANTGTVGTGMSEYQTAYEEFWP